MSHATLNPGDKVVDLAGLARSRHRELTGLTAQELLPTRWSFPTYSPA